MLKTMPDILLAACPPGTVEAPPLGLAYLATNLRRTGFAVEICDINHRLFVTSTLTQRDHWQTEKEQLWRNPDEVDKLFYQWGDRIDRILNEILSTKAPVLGFSVMYPNEIFTCHMLKALKTRAPERRIVLGGPGCNSDEQRQFLVEYSSDSIDFFVVGEAEQTLTQVLRAFQSGGTPEEVPGLMRANSPLPIPPKFPVPAVKNISYPTFEEFDLAAYGRKSLPIIWSRGCLQEWVYCKKNSFIGKYRMRPVSSIMDELYDHLERYSIRNFDVQDGCVNGRPKELESVCDAIIHSSLDITWSANAIPLPGLTRRLLRKMRYAGCHTVTFQIETGSDHVSEQAAIPSPLKTTERVLKHAHLEGIKVAVNFVIDPYRQDKNAFDATQEFLHRNQHWIDRLENVSTLTNQPPQRARLGYLLNPLYWYRGLVYFLSNNQGIRRNRGGEVIKKMLRRILGDRGILCEVATCESPVFKGINDVSRSYVGPQVVHLDLTNKCNLDCIACWYRSPVLTTEAVPPELLKKTLPYEIITDLIDDLVQMGGVRQIRLGGGGEPTMHPRFKDILSYIKSQYWNIELEVNTNFTLVNQELFRFMMEVGVDQVTVSLWAGTPEAYVKTHPGQSEKKFERLVRDLKAAVRSKINGKPKVSIHNVLMNLNYRNLEAMLELALDIGTDEISYALIDPIPGKTEHLLLNHQESLDLRDRLRKIGSRIDKFERYVDPVCGKSLRVANFFDLLRKLSRSNKDMGSYDKKAVNRMPCYIGWIFTRIMADGKVVPCCKGHRLAMGELHKQSFKNIWHSRKYTQFRINGLKLSKSNPYFAVMGNDFTDQTGCYNCDNVMHNLVAHRKILSESRISKWIKFELYRWIDQR
jgi:MoaA/NifB/PqqE/SkfB family radical SAM enzyme